MEEPETIRKWFANLPSGASRSCSAAIDDKEFIEYYLECAKLYHNTSSFSADNGDAIIDAIVSGADAEFYKETKVENSPYKPFTFPEFVLSTIDFSISYKQPPNLNNAMESSSPIELIPGSKRKKAPMKQQSDPISSSDDEPIATLHFASGKVLPINTKRTKKRRGSKNVKANQNEKVVHQNLQIQLGDEVENKCIISETTYTIPKYVNSTKRAIIEAKIQASKALEFQSKDENRCNEKYKLDYSCNKNARRECSKQQSIENPMGQMWLASQSLDSLHNHLRVISSVLVDNLDSLFRGDNKNKRTVNMEPSILCLDPEYLSLSNGGKLFSLADDIIRQNHWSGPTSGFLSTSLSCDKFSNKNTMWPQWLYGCLRYNKKDTNKEGDSTAYIPFHLILLAKIEIAIVSSYHHHLKDGAKVKRLNQQEEDVQKESLNEDVVKAKTNTTKSLSTENKIVLTGNVDETKIHHRNQLASIISKGKKLRKLGEKYGVKRCRESLENLFSSCNCSLAEMIKKCKGFTLDQALLIPIQVLLSFPFDINFGDESSVFSNAVNKMYSLVVKANATVTHESLTQIHNNTCSGGNRSTSKNKKKNKKKKKKRKNTNSTKSCEKHSSQGNWNSPNNVSSIETPTSNAESQTSPIDAKNGSKSRSGNSKNECISNTLATVSKSTSSDITLRVHGSSAVVVEQHNPNMTESQNDDNWSKVENKSRGNRGRNAQKHGYENSAHAATSQAKSGKIKSGRTSASRKRVAHRKIAKEILASILEGVDSEISRRRKIAQRKMYEERKKKDEQRDTLLKSGEKSSSLRDVVIGITGKLQSSSKDTRAQQSYTNTQASSFNVLYKLEGKSDKDTNSQGLGSKKVKRIQQKTHNADQNTAPTLPETLSGVSAMSNSNNSGGSIEYRQQENISNDSSDDLNLKSELISPPLPTLLSGLRNTNSASSSVASSLEAHGSGEQNMQGKERGVGYHLLSVCRLLSDDMTTFMARRRYALELRRKERGAILVALQDVTAKIWVGRCHVEMYGSCATQLDLPSSDLDVVICGLPQSKSKKKKHGDNLDSMEHNPYHNFPSLNGGRVLRLAAELERQPWAVQVKAIPTASVPVIKMLADPARLGSIGLAGHDMGMNSNDYCPPSGRHVDWMMQSTNSPQIVTSQGVMQQHGAPPMQHNFMSNTNDPSSATPIHPMALMKHFPNHWRGADVMNGLISVDITFQGPEHGGLGSTAYSARVVRDACNETGLPPESTPAVQVTMVLKELLAQRRLNEPFSGGLSSYALLLMVVAIMRERRAIRAEMDLAEKQRKAVSAPTLMRETPPVSSKENLNREPPPASTSSKKASNGTDPSSEKCKTEVTESAPSAQASSNSSWASIAKQTNVKRPPAKEKPPHRQPTNSQASTDGSKQMEGLDNGKTAENDDTDLSIDKPHQKNDDGYLTYTSSENQPSSTYEESQYQLPNASALLSSSFNFSQGSNDVLEVLCSGEPSAGKLLMHFLLFYGQYFDAQTMLVDVTVEDGRVPFPPRQTVGSFDPITGMFTVDPIIVYDPLDDAERRNVSRRCFAWPNIRSIFTSCYTALQHTVERRGRGVGTEVDYGSDNSRLLESLLSF